MNNENLKPPSRSEARERGKKGGLASGESRRESKQIRDALQKALRGKYTIDDKELGGYEAMALSMIKQALSGDVKAFVAIRDTIGEKPVDKVEGLIKNESQELLREYLEGAKNGKFTKS